MYGGYSGQDDYYPYGMNSYYKCCFCEKAKNLTYLTMMEKYVCDKCSVKFVKDLEWQGELKYVLRKVREMQDYDDAIDLEDIETFLGEEDKTSTLKELEEVL